MSAFIYLCDFNISFEATKKWTNSKGCIKGNHLKSNLHVKSLDICRQLCAKDCGCLSVDYNPSTEQCNFNSADTSTVKIQNPCHIPGYEFSEPILSKLINFFFIQILEGDFSELNVFLMRPVYKKLKTRCSKI